MPPKAAVNGPPKAACQAAVPVEEAAEGGQGRGRRRRP